MPIIIAGPRGEGEVQAVCHDFLQYHASTTLAAYAPEIKGYVWGMPQFYPQTFDKDDTTVRALNLSQPAWPTSASYNP